MPRRTLGQIAVVLLWCGCGAILGLILAAVVVFPVGQGLIDREEDEIVDWTIRYFGWVAAGFATLCCFGGAAVGGWIGCKLTRAEPAPVN